MADDILEILRAVWVSDKGQVGRLAKRAADEIERLRRSPPQVGMGMEDAARLILECTDIISEATAKKLAERIGSLGTGSREERSQADPGGQECASDLHGLPWRVSPWGDGSSPAERANILSDSLQAVIARDLLEETAKFIVGIANALISSAVSPARR